MRMNRRLLIVSCLVLLSTIGVTQAEEKQPLDVVPKVDLARYAGQWYEIARLPNRFQKRCAGEVTANYTLKANGTIEVINRCRLQDGGEIQAEGVARVADRDKPNSILKVRFAPGFLSFIPQVWGDYQIIELSPDYTHALVGDPGREYLWILSRSRRIKDATYDHLVQKAREQGFDTSRLQKTSQPEH
jgi:apolipoprotein D and lipocalin family protein